MSSQRLDAMLLPEELTSLLLKLFWRDKAHIYKDVVRGRDEIRDVSTELAELRPLDRFWIAPRVLTQPELRAFPRCFTALGMVQVVFFPSVDNGVLTLTNFGSRSDNAANQPLHNHPLLRRIKKYLLPYLARPVVVRVGTAARAYRDIGYSAGAAEWWLTGRKWSNPLARAQELLMPPGGAVPPLLPTETGSG